MQARATLHLLLLLGAMLLPWPAIADERIVAFHSDIRIAADGSMTVTETIRVRAEGNSIRRGIYREFPTSYRDRLGNRYNVSFRVTGLTRNGRSEPWDSQRYGNGVRIDFGDERLLPVPAEHEYALTYETSRQLGFFADHDELYWNVTGSGWDFPIDQASATIVLPQVVPAPQLFMEGYTGAAGSRGQDYLASVSDGVGMIRTARTLMPHEGLTLVMGWPKGIVDAPTRADRAGDVLQDNTGLLLALLTLVANFLYLGAAWSKVGRDPDPGVIFPHYQPPAGCSPAMARYLLQMGYDGKVLTAALVDLAVQGCLQIAQHGRRYTLERRVGTQSLPADEQALYESLFAQREQLVLDNSNHAAISGAHSVHATRLGQAAHGIYFLGNARYLLPSLLASVLMLLVIVMQQALVPLVIGIFLLIALLHAVFGWLLKAPTAAGRALMDQLEGFRLYLDVAEKEEMNLRNPPELTPVLFERYLPYAIALGVEQAWGARFSRALEASQTAPAPRRYQPLWYSGRFDAGHIGDFTREVSSGFNTAIASAATPPGSRSGARGRGFSGGGGGGGGGGGR